MTVAELINKLQEFDQDLPVGYYLAEYGDYIPADSVGIREGVWSPHEGVWEARPRGEQIKFVGIGD